MFKRKRILSKPPNRNVNRAATKNPFKRKRTNRLPSRTMGVNEERDTTETIPDNAVRRKRTDSFPPQPMTTNMDAEPTEAIPNIEPLTEREENENPEIKEKLILARELMDSVRKDIEIDCLQTAISSLQDILDSGRERYAEEDRARIAHYLVKALLIRYGIYGWIEDLDTCTEHFNNAVKSGSDVMFEAQEGDENIVEIQPAIQLIQTCRNSLDHDNLNTVISVVTQVLPSHGIDNPTLQYADLLILLGNALMIKYLANNDVANLEEASTKFQELGRTTAGHMGLNYVACLSLGYVELLRVIEGSDIEGLFQFVDVLKVMQIVDKEGEKMALIGEEMTEHNVDDALVNKGIAFLTKALRARPAPHPRRVLSLESLGRARLARFQRKGDFGDLTESIALFREVLDLRPAPHPDRADSLNSLAVSLSERFDHKGSLDDLEEHITLVREALNLSSTSDPNHSVLLNNLATALCTRFKQKGAFEDLEQCIACHREVLTLRPPPHPDLYTTLNNLAIAVSTRFRQKGAFNDLEESILLHREALNLFPESHPDRSISLSNLATALLTRFEQGDTLEDLQECIMLLREAVNLQPIPHPDRFGSLKNLATAMTRRFEQTGTLGDLEEGITLFREALDLRQAPYPDYSVSLSNLANALATRFGQTEAFEDFKECLTLYQEVLNLQPAPHPMRCESLNNIAAALLTYFEHKDAFQDFDPFLESFLGDLASSLDTKFDNHQDDPIIETALHCFEEASKYETGSLLQRLEIARTWTICAEDHHPSAALDAYRYAMTLLPLLASLDLTLQQRQDVLQHTQALARNAAKAAIIANQCDVAVGFLSSGRSIFWSQALQLRTSVDELTIAHPAHAEKLIALSQQLENASYSGNQASMPSTIPSQDSGTYRSLYSLAAQHRQTIEEIRKLPKFEEFLSPPSLAALRNAANDGPIALLNASKLGCDALVIIETRMIQHVPLPDIHMEELEELIELIRMVLQPEVTTIDVSQGTIDLLQRLLGRDMILHNPTSNGDTSRLARLALEGLWVKVVMPVVMSLGLKKSDSTKRIWWCPTGPFSYLPIHAAGIYSDDNDPIDCIFQYAVSSYCTSPQDLLHSQPQITEAFKMTAIIEPEAPGAVNLPATRQELKVIEKHIPNPGRHITQHIGTKDSSTSVGGILSDIQESSFTHFGCHGMQDLNNPLESHLLLSGGRLTMEKIIKECQVPEGALAYLSACETAKGDEVRPDESLNLVATMMFAGFRSVVGTMWSILDEDAPIVADVFYGHLFRNGNDTLPDVRDASYGLHLATKELRERGRPFSSWVPYVHYGI